MDVKKFMPRKTTGNDRQYRRAWHFLCRTISFEDNLLVLNLFVILRAWKRERKLKICVSMHILPWQIRSVLITTVMTLSPPPHITLHVATSTPNIYQKTRLHCAAFWLMCSCGPIAIKYSSCGANVLLPSLTCSLQIHVTKRSHGMCILLKGCCVPPVTYIWRHEQQHHQQLVVVYALMWPQKPQI